MPKTLFFKFVRDYPDDRELAWTEELQGVTHDDANWYITQKERLWKIPVSFDLNKSIPSNDPSIRSIPIPPDLTKKWDHFGDLDYREGLLFSSLEKIDRDRTARIAVFSADTLEYKYSALLDEQGNKAPWCAINPFDGLLYSSRDDNVDALYVYRYKLGETRLSLTFESKFYLKNEQGKPLKLHSVQGGVFSAANQIYLSSNNDNHRGVHVFDMENGRRIGRIRIPEDSTIGDEIEGLTLWDLDNGAAPGIRGQIHVLELDNDYLDDSDDLKCFKHYRQFVSPYVANCNPRCREVHRYSCRWIDLMLPEHKVPYWSLPKARNDGYDGCHYCLDEYDTR